MGMCSKCGLAWSSCPSDYERKDHVTKLSYLAARPLLTLRTPHVFIFIFFARPTDPPSREGGRWETKHFIGMALLDYRVNYPPLCYLDVTNYTVHSFCSYCFLTDLTVAMSMPEYSSNPKLKFQRNFRMRNELMMKEVRLISQLRSKLWNLIGYQLSWLEQY